MLEATERSMTGAGHRRQYVLGVVVFVAAAAVGWRLSRRGAGDEHPVADERARQPSVPAVIAGATTNPAPARPRSPAATPIDTSTTIELRPDAAGYDGARAMVWRGISPQALFDGEPVDRSWAPTMERALVDVVATYVRVADFDATALEASCRTAACQVTVDAAAHDRAAIETYFQAFAPLGTMVSFEEGLGADGRATIIFTTVYDRASHVPASLRSRVDEGERRSRADWQVVRGSL